MSNLVTVRLTAIFGDGTENYRSGPDSHELRETLEELNDFVGVDGPWDGIAEIVGEDEEVDYEMLEDTMGDNGLKVSRDCESAQDLIDTVVWWCNNAPERESDYEFLPTHATRID